eukprot:GHVU01179660.1.p1 GENE.GHVU01179660.1~~GHVU01179660.1.p1  ORF type:complete len:574 (+),score=43.80 GHVU01179660.1:37-1758(+)
MSESRLIDLGHSAKLANSIEQLYNEGCLYDLALVAEDHTVWAHRVVSAAMSEYFRAMFRSGMREALGDRIVLHCVTKAGLTAVVDFFYTGTINVDWRNIEDVLGCANFLQVSAVVNLCSNFLISHITLENWSEVQHLAELYSLIDVEEAVHLFLLQQFSKFTKTKVFKSLDENQLCSLLGDDRLRCKSEYHAFKALMEWIKFDPEIRKESLMSTLEYIRFSLMTKEELNQARTHSMIKKLEARCLVETVVGQHLTGIPYSPYFKSHANDARGQQHIVSFGSDGRGMHCCIYHKGKWYAMERALDQPCSFKNSSLAVIGNQLFVCGGGTSEAVKSTFCYNPADSRWITLRPMSTARRNFAMVTISDQLMAIGGVDDTDTAISSCETYNMKRNIWLPVANYPKAVSDLAACELDSNVYAAAGIDQHFVNITDCYKYNWSNKHWKRLAPIIGIKFKPSMFGYQKKLLLVDLCQSGNRFSDMEEYDITTNQWTRFECMNVRFSHHFGMAMLNEWVYFVGRNQIDDGAVKRYNTVTGAVEQMKPYPWFVKMPLCCILRLPYQLLKQKMLRDVEEGDIM